METRDHSESLSEITLILGGARSGKSTFAEKLARETHAGVTYLAAADGQDSEMQERIAIHKKRRPAEWKTFEGDPYEICEAARTIKGVLLLDCLTLWLTRLFLEGCVAEDASEKEWQVREAQIRALTEDLCSLPSKGTHLIIVSNEVGFGLVPSYKMGRRFRDLQGRMNQLCASKADRAALIVAGYPIWLKGGWEDSNQQ
ncbi:Bifunctional adenosylcobalamin biosynthesis protein CobP [bioreactor metagenome]|uniref:Adenosylcobinamide kinase n=1 Tax=bioreactor metagenome TaxID=1076179 RepID=A0A645HAR8_9ZZZZ